MTPDYDRAAILAAETLIKHSVSSAPVDPIPILKKTPGVLLVSFESVSQDVDQPRRCVMNSYGENNQDAFTACNVNNGRRQYIVTYNQRLPLFMIQRALARELGHIVLGHDGSLPEDVRNDEAKAFANHLLVPRALIHSILATNLRLTVDLLGNVTGCYDYCLSCIRRLPGAHVPAELNQIIRDNFMPYAVNLFDFQRVATRKDGSALADFGSYMDGYEE